MAKYLRIEMPDGSKWDVPAEVIAHNRGAYYGGDDVHSSEYQEEKEFTLQDHGELIDWAANNMNWSDVKEVAVQVSPSKETDYDEGWMNGDKEVIEK